MRMTVMIVGAVVLAASSASAQTVDRSETAAMVAWINQARAERGVAPLVEDPRLDAVSEAHSVDMASHGFFSHVSPTAGAPDQRAHRAGVPFVAWAENIALNQSPRAAMDSLLQSPGHYQNIVNGGLRAVGIGIVRGPQGVYVTQSFATFDPNSPSFRTPTPAAPVVAPTPASGASARVPVAAPAPQAPARTVDPDGECDVDPQTGDCADCQGDGCDTAPQNTPANTPANAPTTQGSTLPGITGLQLPNLGRMPSVPSLPSLPSVAQGSPIQVRPAARDANGNPNWDVQTPMGSFRVSVPGDHDGGSPIASLLNQLMGVAQPAQTPTATAQRPAARPTERPDHATQPGRVVEVELPPIDAPQGRHAARRARQTASAPAPVAADNNRWTGDF